MRLVAGLKRYFHEKRAQGLLTGRGILVLDHACDAAMDASSDPLLIWAIVERCPLITPLNPLSLSHDTCAMDASSAPLLIWAIVERCPLTPLES